MGRLLSNPTRITVATSAAVWAPAPGQYATVSTALPATVDPCPQMNCVYSGNAGFQAVWTSWNGGAFSTEFGAMGTLLIFGGGHYGWDGNGVVAYDVGTRTWSVLNTPAPFKPNAQDAAGSADGVWKPGSNVGPDGAYPDGTPYPNHTNMGCDVLPSVAGGGAYGSFVFISHWQTGVCINQSVIWRFDLQTKRWSRTVSPAGLEASNGLHALVYDSKRKGLWVCGGGNGSLHFIDIVRGTSVRVGVGYGTGKINVGWYSNLTYIAEHDALLVGTQGAQLVWYDLSGLATAPAAGSIIPNGVTLRTTGTAPPCLFTGTAPDSYTRDKLEPCPRDGGLYILDWLATRGTAPSTARLFKLTPPARARATLDPWVWASEVCAPKSGERVAISVDRNAHDGDRGWYGRFRFVPALSGFVYSDAHDQHAQVVRPALLT